MSPDLDGLFTVPPEEFARARRTLMARLQEAGQTAPAAEAKRLRRPTAPVWAINQIARQEPEGVRRFIEAVDQLRRAHLRGAAGTSEAIEKERSALRHLVTRANRVVTTTGRRWSAEMARRISATLVGAAADRQAREDLRRGRLTQEHSAPGFEALGATPPRLRLLRGGQPKPPERSKAPQRSETPAKMERRADQTAERRAREELRRAREAEREATRESHHWTRRAQELERAAAAYSRAAHKAERRGHELSQRVREIEQRSARDRQRAEQAGREARRAREEAAQAMARGEAAMRVVRGAETQPRR